MLDAIQEIIFKVTGKKDITPDTDFLKDLRLNSFDIVNIIADFESRYKLTVPTKDLWRMHTVRDLINYMAEKGIR